MADLPLAPGQPYVEVEYDYEYNSKGRLISIRSGDCFLLVKKTNEDWWQVRRDDGSKAFYVPAQYVREVRKALMPPGHAPSAHGHAPSAALKPALEHALSAPGHAPSAPLKPALEHAPSAPGHAPSAPGHAPSAALKPALDHGPSAPGHAPSAPLKPAPGHAPSALGHAPSLWVKPAALELPAESVKESSPRRSPSTLRDGSPLHSPTSGPLGGLWDAERGPEPQVSLKHSGSSGTLPRSRGRSPELQREPLDVDSHQGESGDELRSHESESDLSSSSCEQLQTGSDSLHTNLNELKLSGALLPPLPPGAPLPPPPSGAPLSSSGDWDTHRDPSGRLFYVNQNSQERTWKPPRTRDPSGAAEWLKQENDHGRSFYSSADASRSEWELPKLNNSPPHVTTEGAKTRSLDRRSLEPIVLTKWRHSSHVQEPTDKRLKGRRERVGSARLPPYGALRDPAASLRGPGPDSPTSPRPPPSPSEKCGLLNMTKITENGKKVRKNWTSTWSVLQGSKLLFTKGQTGGSSWFGGQSKPELTLDLRGATVDWAPKDRSSKKHVLELKTRQGTELLVQSDNEPLVQEWLRALQDCISTHAWESDEGMDDDPPESPGRDEKNEKEKDHRDSKKDRGVKNSSSSAEVSEHKTRHKLKKFLTRRPTLQAVRDKGYIKDQVFGCSLSSLCQRENSTVPRFVKLCIEHVETNGLNVDGLYRVSGNLAVIQKLRFAVNHDEKVCLSDSKWEDIHVTTGALKMFFRELPEPLFPFNLFHDFISAIKSPDYRQRVQSIKDLIRQLPKANHDTMGALFKHLHRVVDHGEDNRMTIQSVAIVFGPTLLRPETETWNMAVNMVYQNQIVELILIECDAMFGK